MKSKMLVLTFFLLPLLMSAQDINWVTNLDEALVLSNQTGKKVFVFYTGKYCPPCQNMKKGLFKMHTVIEHINENYIPLQTEVYKYSEMTLPQFMVFNQDAGRLWNWSGTISSNRLIAELENSTLGTPKGTKHYLIQFGAFHQLANAKRLQKKLYKRYGRHIEIAKKGAYKVVVMKDFRKKEEAYTTLKKAQKDGFKGRIKQQFI